MAWDILKGLRKAGAPDCWERTHYQLLDRGAGPNHGAAASARRGCRAPSVRMETRALPRRWSGWCSPTSLLDAQPVHRLRVKGKANLEEIYVTDTRRTAICARNTALRPARNSAAYLERLGWPHGRMARRGVPCGSWLGWSQWRSVLARGTVVTIDYGATWGELCSTRWIERHGRLLLSAIGVGTGIPLIRMSAPRTSPPTRTSPP